MQGSVATSDEVAWVVGEADTALGGIDILVNNAGVFPRSPFLELAEAQWDHVLGVNLKGSFLVAQAVARRMVTAGPQGDNRQSIVFVGARSPARCALFGEQGRYHRHDTGDGAVTRAARGPR